MKTKYVYLIIFMIAMIYGIYNHWHNLTQDKIKELWWYCNTEESAQNISFELFYTEPVTKVPIKLMDISDKDIKYVDWIHQAYRFSDTINLRIKRFENQGVLFYHSFMVLRVNGDSICRISLFNHFSAMIKNDLKFPCIYLTKALKTPTASFSFLNSQNLIVIDYTKDQSSYIYHVTKDEVHTELFDCRMYNFLKQMHKIREYGDYE